MSVSSGESSSMVFKPFGSQSEENGQTKRTLEDVISLSGNTALIKYYEELKAPFYPNFEI